MSARLRQGFSLIELLVVCAVVCLLMALLAPAVQMAREQVRAVDCRSRLRQFGVAIADYANVHQQFPPGRLTGGDPDSRPPNFNYWLGRSVHVALLPHVEGNAAYDLFNFSPFMIPRGFNHTAQLARPSLYLCPSDPGASVHPGLPGWYTPGLDDPSGGTWPVAVTHYAFTFGTKVVDAKSYQLNLDDARSRCDGTFSHHPRIAPRDVTDGLSKTAFASEIAVGALQPRFDAAKVIFGGWDFADFFDTLAVHYQPPNAALRLRTYLDGAVPTDVCSPSSAHAGGVHVLMGDGAVQFVSESIDSWPLGDFGPIGPAAVWQAMATRAAGD